MAAIVLAGLVCALFLLQGVLRAKAHGLRELTAPSVIPALYITIATLSPVVWLHFVGPLGPLTAPDLPSSTPVLMALSVLGFSCGSAIRFKRVANRERKPIDPLALTRIGRFLLVFPIVYNSRNTLANAVASRGVEQTTRDLGDSIQVASNMAAFAGVLLIAAGRRHENRLLTAIDWGLLGTLIGLIGLSGNRASVASMLLIILFAYLWRQSSIKAMIPLLIAPAGVALFSYATLNYRIEASGGGPVADSISEAMVRDWSSVPFTTGVVSQGVQSVGTYDGSTLVAALVRQIPSPIASVLFGPIDDTGAYVFRDLYPISSSQGYGFSLPAEGVLNFGTIGAFLAPFFVGTAMAWLYARANLYGTTATSLLYFIAAATLPMAWRSDFLGAIKGVLYPFIFLAALLVVARSVATIHSARTSRRHAALTPRGSSS